MTVDARGCVVGVNRELAFTAHWLDGEVTLRSHQHAGWTATLEVVRVSRGATTPFDCRVLSQTSCDDRVEWRRSSGIREWHINGRDGIEQWLELGDRLPGEGQLILVDLAVTGLRAGVGPTSEEFILRDDVGRPALRIGGLRAWDATGHVVRAFLDARPGIITLCIDDSSATYPLTIDPVVSAVSWSCASDVPGAALGAAVAPAGDVNGDGYVDLLVGAPHSSAPEADEGSVHLFLGGPTGLAPAPSWTFELDRAGALLGASVSTAGDVNGDGFSDVLVGAPGYTNVAVSEGAAFLFVGSRSGLVIPPAWSVEGGALDARFGASVAAAGDVDGDDIDDFLVGAPGWTNVHLQEGRASLFRGSRSAITRAPDWTADGGQPGARLGQAVAPAGDVNGDGLADVVVGAPGFDDVGLDEGRALVFHGSGTGLAASPAWAAGVRQAGAAFGSCVQTAGDVNGDGFADVIVGAPLYDDAETDAGGAFVYAGGPLGLSTSPTATYSPNERNARAGTSVFTAGDVNDDGFADVSIGVPLHDGGGSDSGLVVVQHGSPTGPLASTQWTRSGPEAGARLGSAVAMVGDVDGDGFSEVVLGAEGSDFAAIDGGAVFVHRGSASTPPASPVWTSEGERETDWWGDCVAVAGDVDADGYSDAIVMSASYENGIPVPNRLALLRGSSAGLTMPAQVIAPDGSNALDSITAGAGDVNGDGYSDVLVVAGLQLFILAGSATGLDSLPRHVWSGNGASPGYIWCVGSAGDVNGDGFSDVIVGLPNWDDPSSLWRGRAAVLHGSATGLVSPAAWSVYGVRDGTRLGSTVATAGDVNRDGYSDVLVGTANYSNGETNEGVAYLYLGSPSGLAMAPSWEIEGDAPNALLGYSISTCGDINRDGYSDFAVSVPGWSASGEGRVLVFHGSATGPSTTPSQVLDGLEVNALLGLHMATAGDVNGDGFSDLALAAPYHSGMFTNEGQVFLFLGSPAGLDPVPAWSVEGGQAEAGVGLLAGGGDLDGDGFADILVGNGNFDGTMTDIGRVMTFHGNGMGGLDRIPRQRTGSGLAPVDLLGGTDEIGVGAHVRARSPFGRDRVRVEVEVERLDTDFDGSGLLLSPWTDTGLPGATGSFTDLNVLKSPLSAGPHHWRARLRGSFPYPWQGHWMSMPGNSPTETDVRAPCAEPSPLDRRPAATPLRVVKVAAPDLVSVSWEDVLASSYNVYGGEIADLAPARPLPVQVVCDSPGTTTLVAAPGPGRWLVVVASCDGAESSYGRDSFGMERDRATAPCP